MKVFACDLRQGYPARTGLYYRCKTCNRIIESLPVDFATCECGNITIDVGGARMSAREEAQLEVLVDED